MKKKTSKGTSVSNKKQHTSEEINDSELTDEKSVSKSDGKDKNMSKSFPGYPHYPSTQDILNPVNKMKKAEVDVEDLSRLGKTEKKKSILPGADPEILAEQPVPVDLKDDNAEVTSGSESDVTQEEMELLGSDELNSDLGEDEELKKRVYPVDMAAEDLDVPGSDLDDENEEIGEEDEENNPYSIGGDRHEDLEEEGDSGR